MSSYRIDIGFCMLTLEFSPMAMGFYRVYESESMLISMASWMMIHFLEGWSFNWWYEILRSTEPRGLMAPAANPNMVRCRARKKVVEHDNRAKIGLIDWLMIDSLIGWWLIHWFDSFVARGKVVNQWMITLQSLQLSAALVLSLLVLGNNWPFLRAKIRCKPQLRNFSRHQQHDPSYPHRYDRFQTAGLKIRVPSILYRWMVNNNGL